MTQLKWVSDFYLCRYSFFTRNRWKETDYTIVISRKHHFVFEHFKYDLLFSIYERFSIFHELKIINFNPYFKQCLFHKVKVVVRKNRSLENNVFFYDFNTWNYIIIRVLWKRKHYFSWTNFKTYEKWYLLHFFLIEFSLNIDSYFLNIITFS